MNPVLRHIDTLMRSDGSAPVVSLAPLLRLGACLYKTGVHIRNAGYRKGLLRTRRLSCKVLSIGNITAGGTGKTPMSIYVASAIRRMGLRVAILSRGYQGACEKSGGVVSDGSTVRMDPAQAGDEPYLMASKLTGIPVLVGRNRYRMGQIAIDRFDTDVIVLDDGFQHVALARDLDILLLDDRRPFGNRHLLPRGTLREPVSALARSDAVVLTRTAKPESVSFDSIRSIVKHRPVFKSHHHPRILKIVGSRKPPLSDQPGAAFPPRKTFLAGRSVFAFSGIGGNADFHQTVQGLGCTLLGSMDFPDHHVYSDGDLERIDRAAFDAGAELLVTTEKDYVRIADGEHPFSRDLAIVGIETAFTEDTDGFLRFLETRLLPKMERCT